MRHIRCCCGRFCCHWHSKNWFRCHVAKIVGKAVAVKIFSNICFLWFYGYWMYFIYWLVHVFSGNKNTRNKTHTHTYFLKKKITFDLLNFLKLSVHVFCLAEKAKLRRTNSRTNCQQNKITICHTIQFFVPAFMMILWVVWQRHGENLRRSWSVGTKWL